MNIADTLIPSEGYAMTQDNSTKAPRGKPREYFVKTGVDEVDCFISHFFEAGTFPRGLKSKLNKKLSPEP